LRLGVELQDADGVPLLPGGQVRHEVVIRRQSTEMDRADTGVVRSFTFNNLTFQSEGDFSFVISIDDEVTSRLRFSIRRKK
jgi:hypothetical protein